MITIQAKVENARAIDFLSRYSIVFSMLVRKLFVDFYKKEKPLADLKSSYQREYGILARHFNSLASQTKGKWTSRKAQYKSTIAMLERKIKDVSKKIGDESKKIEKLEGKIDKILIYKQQVNTNTSRRKRKMPASLRKLDIKKLKSEVAKSKKFIDGKTIRKASLESKLMLEKKNLEKKRICFGGDKLFQAQFNLEDSKFDSHKEWKEKWSIQRNGYCFFIGSHEETRGNQNAQWDPNSSTLELRVPPHLEDLFGKYVTVPLRFSEDHLQQLNIACSLGTAISYRFSKRVDTTRTGRYKKLLDNLGNFLGFKANFYCYVSFESCSPKMVVDSKKQGVVGLDINADHLALVTTDASGNPVDNYSVPHFVPGKTTHQNKAILGDCVANILDYCRKVDKPLVIERLDFNKKKQNLRENGKGAFYNRMLSEFQFKRIREMLLSRAKKCGVKVISVNPAFTSVIGAYKYRGLTSLTSHQCAALVIARRGQGFREGSKIFRDMHSPDRMNQLDLGSTPAFLSQRKARHVWSYWRSHTRKIRATLRESAKEGLFDDKAIYLDQLLLDPGRPSSLVTILQVFRERGRHDGRSWQKFCQQLDQWTQGRLCLPDRLHPSHCSRLDVMSRFAQI